MCCEETIMPWVLKHFSNQSCFVSITNKKQSDNITLLNDTPNIKFTTGNELIIKDTNNYIGFINNNIKIYQPLDLSPNGIIKFG